MTSNGENRKSIGTNSTYGLNLCENSVGGGKLPEDSSLADRKIARKITDASSLLENEVDEKDQKIKFLGKSNGPQRLSKLTEPTEDNSNKTIFKRKPFKPPKKKDNFADFQYDFLKFPWKELIDKANNKDATLPSSLCSLCSGSPLFFLGCVC